MSRLLKRNILLSSFLLSMMVSISSAEQQDANTGLTNKSNNCPEKIDYRVWSISYWQELAEIGCVPVTTEPSDKKPIYTSSKISSPAVITVDSPDVPIINLSSTTQSENSVFIDPLNHNNVLNSNNSTNWPLTTIFGASHFASFNTGQTWTGSIQGAGGQNSGDPATAIDLNGRYYIGYITQDGGQGVAWSSDRGINWNPVQLTTGPGGGVVVADKNHLWVDNSSVSPFQGNLYSAWTRFDSKHVNNNQIEISRSTDKGLHWSAPVNISTAINAGNHNQGVNIQTAASGEVYAVWAVYDSIPYEENAIGFAKSIDGGVTWSPAVRILSQIRGIRLAALGGGKTMRVNSFPSMTVDPFGNIYVVWTNIGQPGINAGDPDIYMSKSTNKGLTWSNPSRINQDSINNGRDQWFPWIAADPMTGKLACVFYDSRNFSNNDMAETFVAISDNGGQTWTDFKVSDFAWAADGIVGFASYYAGDYLSIDIQSGQVYPVWSDNHTGNILAYTSPFKSKGASQSLDLQNHIALGLENYEALNSITAHNNFVAKNGSNITFETGNSISLQDGFSSENGSEFRAFITP